MPNPAFEGRYPFPSGLVVFKTLWDLSNGSGTTIRLPPGRYWVDLAGRFLAERHEYSDGYYYAIQPGTTNLDAKRTVGYQWQDRIAACIDAVDADLEDIEGSFAEDAAPETVLEGRQPKFALGASVRLCKPIELWLGLNALQLAKQPRSSRVRRLAILDVVGHVRNDDHLFEEAEIEFDEEEFYICEVRLPDRTRRWTTEGRLEAAIQRANR